MSKTGDDSIFSSLPDPQGLVQRHDDPANVVSPPRATGIIWYESTPSSFRPNEGSIHVPNGVLTVDTSCTRVRRRIRRTPSSDILHKIERQPPPPSTQCLFCLFLMFFNVNMPFSRVYTPPPNICRYPPISNS